MRNQKLKEIIKLACDEFGDTPYTSIQIYTKTTELAKKSGKSWRNLPSYAQVMQILLRADFTMKIPNDCGVNTYVNKAIK